MVQPVKVPDPVKAAAGRAGMRARWGRRRTLRLDEVSEPIRAAIEALLSAEEAARARELASDG